MKSDYPPSCQCEAFGTCCDLACTGLRYNNSYAYDKPSLCIMHACFYAPNLNTARRHLSGLRDVIEDLSSMLRGSLARETMTLERGPREMS